LKYSVLRSVAKIKRSAAKNPAARQRSEEKYRHGVKMHKREKGRSCLMLIRSISIRQGVSREVATSYKTNYETFQQPAVSDGGSFSRRMKPYCG